MIKRITGYICFVVGTIALLFPIGMAGGRFGGRMVTTAFSFQEALILILLIIGIPVIGFLLIKLGLHLVDDEVHDDIK